jgi:hypothetical protein
VQKILNNFVATETKLRLALVIAIGLVVAGCGGGGGGGGGGGSAPTPPTPAPTPAPPPPPALAVPLTGTLVTSVPAPSYASTSNEMAMLQSLNAMRVASGAGLLQQATTLDVAAFGHLKWLALNGGLTHNQTAGSNGFTGVTPLDRIRAAGFAGAIATNETISGRFRTDPLGKCLPTLAPYHFAALLGNSTHVGMSQLERTSIPGGVGVAGQFTCVVKFATTNELSFGQVPPSGAIVNSPANNEKAFFRGDIGGEIPRVPVSIIPTEFSGKPVFVSVRNADFINWRQDGSLDTTVTQFEIKDDLGNVLPVAIINSGLLKAGPGIVLNNDVNVPEGAAILIPRSPLTIGKVYRVNFSATLKAGAPALTKTWTFTATDFPESDF